MAVTDGGSARKPGAGLITESDVEPGRPAAGSVRLTIASASPETGSRSSSSGSSCVSAVRVRRLEQVLWHMSRGASFTGRRYGPAGESWLRRRARAVLAAVSALRGGMKGALMVREAYAARTWMSLTVTGRCHRCRLRRAASPAAAGATAPVARGLRGPVPSVGSRPGQPSPEAAQINANPLSARRPT